MIHTIHFSYIYKSQKLEILQIFIKRKSRLRHIFYTTEFYTTEYFTSIKINILSKQMNFKAILLMMLEKRKTSMNDAGKTGCICAEERN